MHPQETPVCCFRHPRGKETICKSHLLVLKMKLFPREATFLDTVVCTNILPWVQMNTNQDGRLDIFSSGIPSVILIQLFLLISFQIKGAWQGNLEIHTKAPWPLTSFLPKGSISKRPLYWNQSVWVDSHCQ